MMVQIIELKKKNTGFSVCGYSIFIIFSAVPLSPLSTNVSNHNLWFTIMGHSSLHHSWCHLKYTINVQFISSFLCGCTAVLCTGLIFNIVNTMTSFLSVQMMKMRMMTTGRPA